MTTPTTPYGAPPRPVPATHVRFLAHCPSCQVDHEWEQRNTVPQTVPLPVCPVEAAA